MATEPRKAYQAPIEPLDHQKKKEKKKGILEHFSGQILCLYSSLNSLSNTSKNFWIISFLNNQEGA